MPASRRRSTSDIFTLESGRVVQLLVEVALVGTTLLFWRALADPFQVTKLTVLLLAAIVAAVLVVLRRIGTGWIELPSRPVLTALAVFAAALAVAAVTSSHPVGSIVGTYEIYAGFGGYAAALVLCIAAASSYDRRGADRFLGLATIVATIVGAYALLQRRGADPFTWLDQYPVFATLGNPNFAAGWLAGAVPLAAGWAWSSRDDRRRLVAGVVATVVIALGMVATGSFQGIPAALAGTLVGLAVVGLPHRGALVVRLRALPRQGRAAVAAGGGIAALVVVAVAVKLPHGISQGLIERKFFWRAALAVFRDHPVLGSGLDTFADEFFPHRAAEHAIRYGYSSPEAAHSVPLAMLSGGGIVLAASYLLVIVCLGVVLVRGALRAPEERRGLAAALVGSWVAIQVQSFVSIDVPSLLALQWIVAGIALAVVTPHAERVRWGPGAPHTDAKGRTRTTPWRPLPRALVAGAIAIAVVLGWQAVRPVRANLAAATAVHDAKQVDDDQRVVNAARDLRSAWNLAPWEGTYRWVSVPFFRSINNPPEAAKAAQRAAEIDPGRPTYALAAADLYASLGQRDQARHWYERAIAADPDGPPTLRSAGKGLTAIGMPALGERVARDLLRVDPTAGSAWFELGEAQLALGRRARAKASFEEAVKRDPTLQKAVDALLNPPSPAA